MAMPPVAFVPYTQVARARRAEGALSGLSFAVKDVFSVRGHASSAGHPAWARTHPAAERDARVVELLLDQGADLLGVTILDELAYSLAGENPHYGTPENPRAEGRLCGGSSCGSAAAVAGALCDFALGTDTAGSVRVPAAYCGLYGFRPSHGAVSTEGVVPLAPSFDTVGFLARDAQTFTAVARVLLGEASSRAVERVIIAEDALALCDAGVSEVFEDALATMLRRVGAEAERAVVASPSFAAVREAFRRLQARDVWRTHGAWLTQAEPRFSPSVQARIDFARDLAQRDDTDYERDVATCSQLCDRLRELLVPGTLLFVPAVPGVAPRIGTPVNELEITRARTLELTSFASLSGTPQLIVPLHELAGAPLALSFLAPAGSDAWLAQLSAVIERSLSA